jgi:hypothetical protein
MKKMYRTNFFVLYLLLLFTVCLKAQESQKPLKVTIGTLKTELKRNAINFGLSYLKTLDSLLEKQDFLLDGDKYLFLITPDINIKSGDGDSFSSISVKMTGLGMLFDIINIDSTITPNTAKTFHTFPLSIGIETNNKFNTINGIAEIGWVPWYQAAERDIPDFLKRTKIGLFIQSGYKFAVDTTGKTAVGGEIDQSKERTNNALLRAKGSFGIDTKSLLKFNGVGFCLIGNADGWYEFLNSQLYYSIQTKLRLYLTQSQDKYFDFQYQKGSGAPNFNQGDQFGIELTVTF